MATVRTPGRLWPALAAPVALVASEPELLGGTVARAPEHSDRDATLREYLKAGVTVPIEVALDKIIHDPVAAHDIAERITELASQAAERAAMPVTMARERFVGIVQRGAVEAVRHAAAGMRDAAVASSWMVQEQRIGAEIQSHIETQVRTERHRYAQDRADHAQAQQTPRDQRPDIRSRSGSDDRGRY
jgi:hypothetical protein